MGQAETRRMRKNRYDSSREVLTVFVCLFVFFISPYCE